LNTGEPATTTRLKLKLIKRFTAIALSARPVTDSSVQSQLGSGGFDVAVSPEPV
jgi:hypothetical protein